MDPLGNVIKDFLRQTHASHVRNAVSLAKEFKDEGMTNEQIEEMLFSSGFDSMIIAEAMEHVPTKKNGKNK